MGSRRERARAHARHIHYCTCGRAVNGNGAKYQHREMHARKKDDHRYVVRGSPEWERVFRPERSSGQVVAVVGSPPGDAVARAVLAAAHRQGDGGTCACCDDDASDRACYCAPDCPPGRCTVRTPTEGSRDG